MTKQEANDKIAAMSVADPTLTVADLLVDFVIYVSGIWESGNEDDELAASKALDAFLAGEER
jgi:hypothetical protein